MNCSISTLVCHSIRSYRDKIFYLDETGTLSFNELSSKLASVQHVLYSHGLHRADTVAFTLDLNYLSVSVIIALFAYGYRVVPIYPETSQPVLEMIIEQTCPALFIHDPKINTRFSLESFNVRNQSTLTIDSIIKSLIISPSECIEFSDQDIDKDDTACVIFSSGTTGLPKGICLSQSSLVEGASIVSQYLRINSNDVILSSLRPNFDYGLNQIWCCLLTGATLSGFNMRNPSNFVGALERTIPTIVPLMPAIIDILSNSIITRALRNSPALTYSIRLVCSSGGKLFPEQLQWLESTFYNAWICPMFGLSEAFRSSYVPHMHYKKKSASIGIPIPSVELLIIGNDDEVLAPGQIGELVHLGGVQAQGYLNNPQATNSRFRPLHHRPDKRVVRSGDLAFMDADGFFYHIGRIDEQMKILGIRVSPTEVEDALLRYPPVIRTVAFGSDIQEGPQKILVCMEVSCDFTHKDFHIFILNQMPPHYRPVKYLVVESFPVTGNGGKIDRSSIKASFHNSTTVVSLDP